MIHGVQLPELDAYNEDMHAELRKLSRDFAHSSGDIFFQLGCINTLQKKATKTIKAS
jgi:hypothetical protein